ncbi:hypothetical protein HMPREF0496_0919 [Lentilactobacillus hilgardii ATCC 27305]|nr:hypothetical protein HMPREF0496_0919 [Lentilactobacillus hilgardii ATCC 27305]
MACVGEHFIVSSLVVFYEPKWRKKLNKQNECLTHIYRLDCD